MAPRASKIMCVQPLWYPDVVVVYLGGIWICGVEDARESGGCDAECPRPSY